MPYWLLELGKQKEDPEIILEVPVNSWMLETQWIQKPVLWPLH